MRDVRTQRQLLHEQVADEMRSLIHSGRWPIGAKLSRDEIARLQRKYETSRTTMEKAFGELEATGYVSRRPGVGTVVRSASPSTAKIPQEIVSFTERLSRAGLRPGTELIAKGAIQVARLNFRLIQRAYGMHADEDVYFIQRRRLGGEEPYSLQSVFLLPRDWPGILDQDLRSLFRLYETGFNRRVMAADETIGALLARDAWATPPTKRGIPELLACHEETPVLVRERVSYDAAGQPMEVLHSIDRADKCTYRYQIVNELAEPDTRLTKP